MVQNSTHFLEKLCFLWATPVKLYNQKPASPLPDFLMV